MEQSFSMKDGDIIVYGPHMDINSGFDCSRLRVHSSYIDAIYVPTRVSAESCRDGIYSVYLSRQSMGKEKPIVRIGLRPSLCQPAIMEELVDFISTTEYSKDLFLNQTAFYKCWNRSRDEFIYVFIPDRKRFRSPEGYNDITVQAAFNGVSPNRPDAYPFCKWAIWMVKTGTGVIKRIHLGKYTSAYLFNTYPYGEKMESLTVDSMVDAVMDFGNIDSDITIHDYLLLLNKWNRGICQKLPTGINIHGRLVMKAYQGDAFLVSKHGKALKTVMLCPDNCWNFLVSTFEELGDELPAYTALNTTLTRLFVFTATAPEGLVSDSELADELAKYGFTFESHPRLYKAIRAGVVIGVRNDDKILLKISVIGRAKQEVFKAKTCLSSIAQYYKDVLSQTFEVPLTTSVD